MTISGFGRGWLNYLNPVANYLPTVLPFKSALLNCNAILLFRYPPEWFHDPEAEVGNIRKILLGTIALELKGVKKTDSFTLFNINPTALVKN